MHNLNTNFDKILDITKSFFQGSLNADDNYYFYPNKPKMSDCEVITLSVLCESIGIDSENYLFGKLKSDHFKDFPNLIHRSRFNRRRKRLGDLIARLNYKILSFMNEGENIYWLTQFQFLFVRSQEKNHVKSVRKILRLLLTKGILQLVNPGTLGTNYTLPLLSEVSFPAWI